MKTTLCASSLFAASVKQFRIALLISFLCILSSFSRAQTIAPASCDNTVYTWGSTTNPASVNPTTGTYTAPNGGPYLIRITAAGAQGGSGQAAGGSGVVTTGTFVVNGGQQLDITAGAQGGSGQYAGGGGGGSGVYINGTTNPLIIAGGGGGGATGSGGNALTSNSGSNTGPAGSGGTSNSIVYAAGNGGGLNSAGIPSGAGSGIGGFAGTGGSPYTSSGTGTGTFSGAGGGGIGGGGGGLYNPQIYTIAAGGGGGGYSGGNGGLCACVGGVDGGYGGGSLNNGANTTVGTSNAGGGYVTIQCLGPAASTITTISSNLNPSFTATPNNYVTFTATITSFGTMVGEGTVSFTSNGNPIPGPSTVAVSNGQATFTTTLTSEGSYNISANYNGSSNFAPSRGSLTQTVNNHTTASGNSFCNSASGITASATGVASPYPSEIFVTGLSGTVNAVTVSINGFQSVKPSSVELLLVGPANQTLVLLNGYGGTGSNPYTIGNITFSDAGVTVPGTLTSGGTFKPTAVDPGTLSAPAPAGPYNLPAPGGSATLASVFNGISPNGTWKLYEYDNYVGTSPTLISSWCLNFTIIPSITSVTPSSGQQGQPNIPVAIVGQNTHFVNGTSTAGFGAGITVNLFTVTDATHATASITVDPAAAAGSRDVSITTGTEVATLTNGFMVTAGPLAITNVVVTQATCNNLSGASAVVTASGGSGPLQYSFDGGTTWQSGNTLSSSTTPAISLPATLSIIVKDQNFQQVTYSNNPVLVHVPTCCTNPALNTVTVCENNLATLTASATGESTGLTFQWYSNTTNSNSNGTAIGSNPAYSANTTPGSTTVNNVNVSYVTTTQDFSPPTSIAGTTYYYYTATGPGGSVTCNVAGQVNVNPLPTASINNSTGTVASGSSPSISVTVNVPATDAWTLVLSDNTSYSSTGSGTFSIPATTPISTQTTYTIQSLTDNTTSCAATTAGLTGSETVSIITITSVLSVNGSSSICGGTSTNLVVTVTGGTSPYTVVYSNGTSPFTVTNYTSGTNIPVSPTVTTTYALVSVTDANLVSGTGNSGTPMITVNDPLVCGKCPSPQGVWKNNPATWAPSALPMLLGTSRTYTKTQLIIILNKASGGDASIILAEQLIAAKLNLASGVSATQKVLQAISAADAAIGTKAIPMNVKTNTSLGKTMTSLATTLEQFNNGLLNPGCSTTQLITTSVQLSTGMETQLSDNVAVQNYPNPFTGTTSIRYTLPAQMHVLLEVYNNLGQRVAELVNSNQQAGLHEAGFNGVNHSAGIYHYRLQTIGTNGKQTIFSGKMMRD